MSEGGGAAALVPPQYGAPTKHSHAKVGGGAHTHTHPGASEGHRHRAGSEDGHPDVGLLPMVKAASLEEPAGAGEEEGKAERQVDQQTREDWAKRGWARPDGSYPIPDLAHGGKDYLRRAIQSFGRGGANPADKAHIIKRAQALGLTAMLPDDWQPAKAWFHDFDIKAVTAREDGTLLLRGFANTWDTDRDGETTAKGAFDASLSTFMTNPVLLYNHREGQEIGTVSLAEPREKGLYVEAEVPPPAPGAPGWHVKVYSDIKRRILRAFSMGGVFHRGKGTASRTIERVDLYEVSVVSIPANQTSLFELAEAKGLTFAEAACGAQDGRAEALRANGRGAGSGAGEALSGAPRALDGKAASPHHHGARGGRGGRTHSHPGGTLPHLHGSHSHVGSTRLHLHGAAPLAHTHPGTGTPTKPVAFHPVESTAAPAALTAGELSTKAPPPDDDDQAPDDAGDGSVDELLTALQAAIDEVVSRDDLDDGGKVESIEAILSEFVDEAQDRLEDSGGQEEEEGDEGPQKALAYVTAKDAAIGQHIKDALTALQRAEERGMPPDDQDQGTQTEGKGAGGTLTVDRSEWEAQQRLVNELAEEKRGRELEAKAANLAAAQLEKEQKAAEEKAKAEAEEQKRLSGLVAVALDQLRAGVTGGRKFRHPQSTEGNGTQGTGTPGGARSGGKGFTGWLRDLRAAKKGDYSAYQRLTEQQQKAAEWYATDENGELDTKALGEATTGAGGFLVPPQYWQAGIAEFRLAAAKIRRLVTVITAVNSNLVYIPRETGVSTVGWTAEGAAKPSTDQTFGQIAVNIFTLAGISKVSNQLLEDSSPAVDQIVRKDLGRVLGQAEDVAFINGSGAGQPTGILNTSGVLTVAYSAPSSGSGLGDAISAGITAIDSNFFDLPNALISHPRMIAKLRQVKDNQGRYIFEPGWTVGPWSGGAQSFLGSGTGNIPGIQSVNPNTNPGGPVGSVWGLPVWSDANIPTTLLWGGSSYGPGGSESPIILGVWEEAYILERSGVTLDVSNEAGTSFEQNQTWFRGEERIGFTAARQPTAFCFITGLNNSIAG
jgi:HK97 family phage major capsid protein/HK97 family phage prohead protease